MGDSNKSGLLDKLEQQSWPAVYMFKFIAPLEKADKVLALFAKTDTKTRVSGNGNYISVTATPMMLNPQKVLEKYEEAAKIKGIISL